MNHGYVYIFASRRYGTLYAGVTGDLKRRVCEHREKRVSGFTKSYGVKRLVYYEWHENITGAIRREKQLKKWNRQWKIELIGMVKPGVEGFVR